MLTKLIKKVDTGRDRATPASVDKHEAYELHCDTTINEINEMRGAREVTEGR
jgi:hypothetical protein